MPASVRGRRCARGTLHASLTPDATLTPLVRFLGFAFRSALPAAHALSRHGRRRAAGTAPRRARACCKLQPFSPCAELTAHAAQTGERWTLWVRPEGAGTQYAEVEDVDPQLTVSKFKARWAAQEELKVRSSHITLRLVKCGPGVPTAIEDATAGEEAAAVEPLEPRLTLRVAGVADGSSLLAKVAGACITGACAVACARA
jgi:hypothetical protein